MAISLGYADSNHSSDVAPLKMVSPAMSEAQQRKFEPSCGKWLYHNSQSRGKGTRSGDHCGLRSSEKVGLSFSPIDLAGTTQLPTTGQTTLAIPGLSDAVDLRHRLHRVQVLMKLGGSCSMLGYLLRNWCEIQDKNWILSSY